MSKKKELIKKATEDFLKKKVKSINFDKTNSLIKNAKMETLILETEARLYQIGLLVDKINKHKERRPTPISRLGMPSRIGRGDHYGKYVPFSYPEILPKTWGSY